MVRPVNYAATVIPLKAAAQVDGITLAKRHAVGEIDIVRNQDRVTITYFENKALVSRTFVIVRQNACHTPLCFQPYTRTFGVKGCLDYIICMFCGIRSL